MSSYCDFDWKLFQIVQGLFENGKIQTLNECYINTRGVLICFVSFCILVLTQLKAIHSPKIIRRKNQKFSTIASTQNSEHFTIIICIFLSLWNDTIFEHECKITHMSE